MSKKQKRNSPVGKKSLYIVRQFFPDVEKVTDADEDKFIDVEKRDLSSARVRKHGECALAVACKRSEHAKGVIISRSTAYIIKPNNEAVRFMLPPSVSREITSFDRGSGFAAGTYELHRPGKGSRLGARHTNGEPVKSGVGHSGNLIKRFKHMTTGVREVLGGQKPRELED